MTEKNTEVTQQKPSTESTTAVAPATAVESADLPDESTSEDEQASTDFFATDTGEEPMDLDLDSLVSDKDTPSADGEGADGKKAPDGTPAGETKPAEAAPAEPVVEPKAEPVSQQPPVEKKPDEVKPTEPPAPKKDEVQAVEQPTTPIKDAGDVRKEAIELLSKHHYALTPEEVDEFADSPETAVPKLAARVYMDAVQNSLATVFQHLPALVENAIQLRQQTSAAEEKFFSSWPQLREHKNDVVRFGQTYRQLNPTASMDDFIRDVGAQVSVALRIPVEQPQSQAGNGRTQPTPQMPPFQPAASSPPAAPPRPAPMNPFEALAVEEEPLDLD